MNYGLVGLRRSIGDLEKREGEGKGCGCKK
jgi:hypothetical protein